MMRFALYKVILPAFVLWVLLCGNGPAQDSTGVYHTFGMSLNTGMNNQLFTLFTVKMNGMHVIETVPMTREQFVIQAQGVVPSKANPDQENLFKKYEVEACLHPDSTRYYLDCGVLDELWKLRFWEYPFHIMDGQPRGRGWAGKKGSPSPMQMVKLADYGLMNLNGLIKGQDVFRLLKDVSDSTWVDNYRKGI